MRRLYVTGLIIAVLLAIGTLAARLNAYATNGHVWGVKQVPGRHQPYEQIMSDSSAVAGITSAASTWKGVANISLAYGGYTNNRR